ncbi:MAG: hypothetical protein OXG60_14465 [Chloroflexi bacterium]|nr:hypothetical protein [Chloroflexota bacterium]
MSGRYVIAIDRNHDGRFLDLDEDLARNVLELTWRLGLRQPYDSIADYGTAQIALRNAQGSFSPERERLDIGTGVQIACQDGGQRVILFTGFISRVSVDAGDWSEGRSVIHVQDIQPWLEASPARLSPISNVSADTVIDRLLDGALVRRAVVAGYCIIDVPGHDRIDSIRVFPPQNLGRRLQAGKTRFAYVGDWWDETTSIRRAIRDLAESERGRFYINRGGDAVFLNRHQTLVREALSATFVDDMKGMVYAYGDQHINRFSLLMTPREVGKGGTTLWQLARAERIRARTSLDLNLRFADELGRPVGLLEFERLGAAFHRDEEGERSAIRDKISARIIEIGFTSLVVRVENNSARDVFLTDLRVIGKPLYRRDPLELTISDGGGIHLHGLKHLTLDLPALSDIATAQAFASYELARRKHPAGTVRELRLDARRRPSARRLTLFDRIRISETRTGHQNQEYFIIGEEHQVSQGGAQHEIRWTLEPADLSRFVVIGDSDIDDREELIAPY